MSVKRIKSLLFLGMAAVMVFGFATTAQAAGEKEYNVSFKAGSKGTIGGNSSVTQKIAYEGNIEEATYTAMVQAQDGYYFTEWSPKVETTVTKKAVYVAQYAKIINETVYRVNYIDTNGNEVATQKVVTTNDGAAVAEAAIVVDGYQVDANSKTATVSGKGTEITFVYTSTAVPQVITDEQTVTTPGGTTTTTVDGTPATPAAMIPGTTPVAATPGTTPATETTDQTTIADGNVPLDQNAGTKDNTKKDTTTLKDEEVPLDQTAGIDRTSVVIYSLLGILLVLVAGYGIYRFRNSKNV
ncbi:MAG: hypothetical protein RR678_09790 [Lachnospiraceae bacterium]